MSHPNDVRYNGCFVTDERRKACAVDPLHGSNTKDNMVFFYAKIVAGSAGIVLVGVAMLASVFLDPSCAPDAYWTGLRAAILAIFGGGSLLTYGVWRLRRLRTSEERQRSTRREQVCSRVTDVPVASTPNCADRPLSGSMHFPPTDSRVTLRSDLEGPIDRHFPTLARLVSSYDTVVAAAIHRADQDSLAEDATTATVMLWGGRSLLFSRLFDRCGPFRLDTIVLHSDESVALEYCEQGGVEAYIGVVVNQDMTIREIWRDSMAS